MYGKYRENLCQEMKCLLFSILIHIDTVMIYSEPKSHNRLWEMKITPNNFFPQDQVGVEMLQIQFGHFGDL